MFTYATEGCPEALKEPEMWSDIFKEFLDKCLQIDAKKRSTAAELLEVRTLFIYYNNLHLCFSSFSLFLHLARSLFFFSFSRSSNKFRIPPRHSTHIQISSTLTWKKHARRRRWQRFSVTFSSPLLGKSMQGEGDDKDSPSHFH